MPKVVDKEARRDAIVTAYLELVRREGIEKATTRALARELGVAVGSLWVYFDSVDDVREAAFERTWQSTNAPIAQLHDSGVSGLAGFVGAVDAVLPTRETSPVDARMSMEFLQMPGRRDHVYSVQRRVEEGWRAAFAEHLVEARRRGELVAGTDADALAELVLALLMGLQMEYVIGSSRGTVEGMWRLVGRVVGPWLAPGVALPRPGAVAAIG